MWIHVLMQYFKVFSKQKSTFEVIYHQHLVLQLQFSTEWILFKKIKIREVNIVLITLGECLQVTQSLDVICSR